MQARIAALVFMGSLSFHAQTWAQEIGPVSPAEPVNDVASAKELNRKGLILFDAGNYAGALPFFESSRALVRSHANTRNVALCLDALGRKREALAMFETLLRDYPDKLKPEERLLTEKRIAELRVELEPAPASPKPAISVTPSAPGTNPSILGPLSVGIFLGYAGGSGLGSDAEAYVATNCADKCPGATGMTAGARVGYRVSRLFTVEISGGYLQLGSTFAQAWKDSGYTYAVEMGRVFTGGFFTLGTSLRWPLGSRVHFVGRFGMGGLFSSLTNETNGSVGKTASDQNILLVQRDREVVMDQSLFMQPELGIEIRSDSFVVGLGLGTIIAAGNGPSFGKLRLRTIASACANTASAACAPDLNVSTGNRAHGTFALFVPQLSLRYQFD